MGMVSAADYQAGKFLQESELLDSCLCCPWCGFTGERRRVLQLQLNPDVWLLRCPRCHAVSTSRFPTEAALYAYYASYYVESSEHRVTCGDPQRHARHICRYAKLGTHLPRIGLLDFGGGDGSISYAVALELVRQSNVPIDIFVVDYNDHLVVPALPGITMSHAFSLEQIPAGRKFHIVLASAILEHLPQPAGIVRRLADTLVPGGYLYARTPYMVPLLSLLARVHIRCDFTFPAHLHDLGQDFWENVLPILGLAEDEWALVRSQPSVVETSFSQNLFRSLLAYFMKAPWWLLGRSYPFTGGWEVLIHRKS